MLWYIPIIVYSALACATVDPLPQPKVTTPAPPPVVSQPIVTPRPDLPVICRQINEWAQQYPSLNP